jgi:hypothetical protein
MAVGGLGHCGSWWMVSGEGGRYGWFRVRVGHDGWARVAFFVCSFRT